MASELRTRAARERAEEALVRFALLAGDHSRDFVVIGGLNPDFLAPKPPAPHLGTTDVDLLFELGFVYDRDDLDFAWLDEALDRGRFRPRSNAAGWQWDAILGEAHVRLDLLCDVVDHPGQTLALPGADAAAVQNLSGPAPALHEAIDRPLAVPLSVQRDHPDAPRQVHLRFASLGGYLAAKAAALTSRGKPKDAYDLMFVALYNPGGIPRAVEAVLALPTPLYRDSPLNAMEGAMAMLALEHGEWAGYFAEQMQQAGDEETGETLRLDAALGARRFLEDLHSRA